MATQVQPPLLDKVLVNMFMVTLQTPYLEKMIKSVSLVFSNLVITVERIKSNMKNDKLPDAFGTQAGLISLLLTSTRRRKGGQMR